MFKLDKSDEFDVLLEPLERFVLSYAPASARRAWSGLLLLERRLADTARPTRDPLMVQLRLAWWRDRFAQSAAQWPKGEPLLELLRAWDAQRGALAALVDGWEAQVVGDDGGADLKRARIEALVVLADLLGVTGTSEVRRAAHDWLEPEAAGAAPSLPRAMRPLAILRGLAVRDARGQGRARPLGDFAAALRLGWFGR